jgi:hypothetical protein
LHEAASRRVDALVEEDLPMLSCAFGEPLRLENTRPE